MQKAVIFINGNLTDLSQVSSHIGSEDFIICVNGGTKNAAKLNIIPNGLIGDFDSLSRDLQTKYSDKKIEWIKYSSEKDFTDSELAFTYAREHGYQELIVCGILGNRVDHFITNILQVASLIDSFSKVIIIEGDQ